MTTRRLAVVGSGVAGLTAAYVASRTAEVTLYEADTRLGGHADTHLVADPATGRELAIDTGFIVHNQRTYPVLLRLFAELGVATQESEMSLSDQRRGHAGWSGRARSGRPACSRRLATCATAPTCGCSRRSPASTARPGSSWTTPSASTRPTSPSASSSTGAGSRRTSGATSSSRSSPPSGRATPPSPPTTRPRTCSRSSRHHGMLGVFGSPTWRTVAGGSRSYVDRVAAAIAASGGIRTGAPVIEVSGGDSVTVRTATDEERYDAVVVATHPEQALALLADPSPVQRKVLGALPYSRNTALLHTDTPLLPKARRAWASWNFRRPVVDQGSVQVTYDLTRLQRLPTPTHYLVTLGAEHLVDPATVIARRDYEHPLYSPTSVAARDRLDEVDTARVRFAGAYHGWGFHEDGARSGLAAVEGLGLRWSRSHSSVEESPWRPSRAAVTRPRRPTRRPSRTPGARRSAVPSGTARTCGSSTSIGSPTPASLRGTFEAATTSTAGPRRSARVSTRSSTSTASTSAADGC